MGNGLDIKCGSPPAKPKMMSLPKIPVSSLDSRMTLTNSNPEYSLRSSDVSSKKEEEKSPPQSLQKQNNPENKQNEDISNIQQQNQLNNPPLNSKETLPSKSVKEQESTIRRDLKRNDSKTLTCMNCYGEYDPSIMFISSCEHAICKFCLDAAMNRDDLHCPVKLCRKVRTCRRAQLQNLVSRESLASNPQNIINGNENHKLDPYNDGPDQYAAVARKSTDDKKHDVLIPSA